MRLFASVMFVASLTVSTASQATLLWSPCQTIIGVVHEPIGSNGNLLLTLSPGITGCSAAGITGSVEFMIGQDGVTLDYLGGFLASSLSANATGKTVQITYDNTSSNCYATAIAVGGTNGQCP